MRSEGLSRRQALGALGAVAATLALPATAAFARPLPDRGVNIPLWLDQNDGSDQPPGDAALRFLRQSGFGSIRLPLSPERFAAGGTAEQRRLRDALARLDRFAFSVTLDLHPLGAFRDELELSPGLEALLVRALSAIAEVAADHDPDRIFVELLNEPPLWQDRWLPLRDRLAAAVRARTDDHTIVWGANRFQSITETLNCPPLTDSRACAAVHYYLPMSFTHQCQNWGATSQVSAAAVMFPGPDGGIAEIEADFERLAGWMRTTGTPVLLNEFGTLGVCSDDASRAVWTSTVRRAAEANGIGWSYWEFDRGFGFVEDRQDVGAINQRLLDSLVRA